MTQAYGDSTRMSLLNEAGDANISYNNVKEVVALRHEAGNVAIVNRTYDYNRAYMRTQEILHDIIGAPMNTFALDSTYRIRSTDLGADGSPEGFSTRIGYTLDSVGNRQTVDFTQIFGGTPVNFTHNYLSNEMNEYDDISGAGGPRSHDDNGNLTQANGRIFVYDYRNRLVEVRRQSDRALIARYEYDALNRRVKKFVFDPGNLGTVLEETRYLYAEWQVIEEWGDDADYSANGPRITFVYGVGIDQPVQMEASASTPSGAGAFYYHQDARNNVVAMTAATGGVAARAGPRTTQATTVVEQTRYDDYGNFEQTRSIDNPYLFQGRRYDPETGLFYFRHRYYDPTTGRFIQRDPVWDPNNMGNQYTFVGNNPVTGRDPMGDFSPVIDTTAREAGRGARMRPYRALPSAPITGGNPITGRAPLRTQDFETYRRFAFCGHGWIIVNDYDNRGNIIGEISLHFSPKGFTMNPTSQDTYPNDLCIRYKSTRQADLRLIEMWKYQIRNAARMPVNLPLLGPWNFGYNCLTVSYQFATYGILTSDRVLRCCF
ncbi:hypothetical protein C2W62_05600 [Candidatus Entotheonella serta]|nr:hypothetical protein C2W62_05600 [Candidatus Entotheonella serta]